MQAVHAVRSVHAAQPTGQRRHAPGAVALAGAPYSPAGQKAVHAPPCRYGAIAEGAALHAVQLCASWGAEHVAHVASHGRQCLRASAA